MFRKKIPSDELFLHFSSKVQNLAVFFFIYSHDSNSILWAQGIKSELVLGRTVLRDVLAALAIDAGTLRIQSEHDPVLRFCGCARYCVMCRTGERQGIGGEDAMVARSCS